MRFNKYQPLLVVFTVFAVAMAGFVLISSDSRAEEVHVFADSVGGGVGTGDGFVYKNGQWSLDTDTKEKDNDTCGSPKVAWPSELQKMIDVPVNSFACDGARLQRLEDDQIQVINGNSSVQKPGSARIAIVQLGANDLRYDQWVTNCYLHKGCKEPAGLDLSPNLREFEDKLTGLLNELQSSYHEVVVLTYYDPSDDEDGCREYDFQIEEPWQVRLMLDRDEREFLREEFLGGLNAAIKSAAKNTEAVLIDIANVLEGHTLCADEPWVLGPSIASISGHSSSAAPLHLTAKGQKAVAEKVAPVIKDLLERS